MKPHKQICTTIVDAIGNTPLVSLGRITADTGGSILLKLEYFNPGGSKKDRIALQMVRAAIESGELHPGQPVVELTSGNTGTGLAIVCRALGHPFIAVMSKGNSVERARMMSALGAEVVLVPQCPGSKPGEVSGGDLEAVNDCAERIVGERGAFRTDQFQMDSNPLAHFCGTGAEIIEQTNGRLDAFVEFVGSGGTFTGIARVLKQHSRDIKCYAVEPKGAAILSGELVTQPNHRIQGGGYSRSLPLFDTSVCDGYLQVSDSDAIVMARRLAKEEGVFSGFSAGANVFAATEVIKKMGPGAVVVCIAADSGLKYLSTDLYP